ncbi:hypothetical protein K1719_001856 [Acacia pycnantha]|nr:hypothetical protein K1719_001856 [Acacia pycnantha]
MATQLTTCFLCRKFTHLSCNHYLNKEILDTNTDTNSDSSDHIEYIHVENFNNAAVLAEPAPLGIIDVAKQAQQLPGSQVKDLLGLIKSAERNDAMLLREKV